MPPLGGTTGPRLWFSGGTILLSSFWLSGESLLVCSSRSFRACSSSRTILGVRSTISSVWASVELFERKRLPSSGMSPSHGYRGLGLSLVDDRRVEAGEALKVVRCLVHFKCHVAVAGDSRSDGEDDSYVLEGVVEGQVTVGVLPGAKHVWDALGDVDLRLSVVRSEDSRSRKHSELGVGLDRVDERRQVSTRQGVFESRNVAACAGVGAEAEVG